MKEKELRAAKEVDVLIKKREWPTRRLPGVIAIKEDIVQMKDGTEIKTKVKRISLDAKNQLFAIIQTIEGFIFARPWNIKAALIKKA